MALSPRTRQSLAMALGDPLATTEILATGVNLGDIPQSQVTDLESDLALLAPLASPTLVAPMSITGLRNAANDAAAAALSPAIPVGGLYRNGSIVMVRVA